ncbi:hypothetical protein ACWCQN_38920 [Streptomyces sp. NPDC001984]|uniref:hypothetical protein n=1 Tax=Streptomyces sp. NPDC002619 TaxID=3364655 RepID=UPI0036BC1202
MSWALRLRHRPLLGRLHAKSDRRQGGWSEYDGELPVIEGTLVCLAVVRLPGNREPHPLCL